MIWNNISDLANEIENRFRSVGSKYKESEDEYSWYNSLYSSNRFRRAHIEVVDKRDTNKIYILHSTVFPHFNDPSPIWGFDVICGPNKITGAFHDFSVAGDPTHFMTKWFEEETKKYGWNKVRDLPDWARAIFSANMVAVGNIQEELEVKNLCELALRSLDYYLEKVGLTQESGADFHMAQDRYCYYQKQNPRMVQSMTAMGFDESKIRKFVEEMLFPESR